MYIYFFFYSLRRVKKSRAAADWDRTSNINNIAPLQIAHISNQQLKSFNLPYQLGYSHLKKHKNASYTNDNSEIPASFETPADADTGMNRLLIHAFFRNNFFVF